MLYFITFAVRSRDHGFCAGSCGSCRMNFYFVVRSCGSGFFKRCPIDIPWGSSFFFVSSLDTGDPGCWFFVLWLYPGDLGSFLCCGIPGCCILTDSPRERADLHELQILVIEILFRHRILWILDHLIIGCGTCVSQTPRHLPREHPFPAMLRQVC